jgi:hypothetical protein
MISASQTTVPPVAEYFIPNLSAILHVKQDEKEEQIAAYVGPACI